jgi:integrase
MTPDSHLIWCGRRASPHDGYDIGSFTHIWRQLCVSTAVLDAGGRPPHLHDLRHSMAVSALHRWYGSGRDPQSKLPYLAAYLGHVSLGSTYYYLHLTPELRQAASQLFHQRFVHLFKKGAMAP